MGAYLRATPALLAVVSVLRESWPNETWGLAVSESSRRPTGTVYPLLERLERHGFLASRWEADDVTRRGPRRRLYQLTEAGMTWADSKLDGRRQD